VIEDNRPVKDLTASDFKVTDNGQPQNIVYFSREREPLSLLILLDISGSMNEHIERMAETALRALEYLTPGDRVAIMVFGRRTTLHMAFTDNLAEAARQIGSAVEEQRVGTGTNINPAVLDAANYIDEKSSDRSRRAILMVTDNLGINYKSPDDVVIGRLLSADIVFNTIVVGRGIRPGVPRVGQYENPDFTPADVFKFADWTGGDAIKAGGRIPFAEMIEKIRDRYTLEYHAPESKPREFRRIAVFLTDSARMRHRNAQIHARNGYFAAGLPGGASGS
jgi:VWFA-related protein